MRVFLSYFMTFSFLTTTFHCLASKICSLLCPSMFSHYLFSLCHFYVLPSFEEDILLRIPLQSQSQLKHLSLILYEGFTPLWELSFQCFHSFHSLWILHKHDSCHKISWLTNVREEPTGCALGVVGVAPSLTTSAMSTTGHFLSPQL